MATIWILVISLIEDRAPRKTGGARSVRLFVLLFLYTAGSSCTAQDLYSGVPAIRSR
jgi:hypothetical protein